MVAAVSPPFARALPVAALLATACQGDPISWAEGDDGSQRIPPPSAATGSMSPDAVADSLLRRAVATRIACAEGACAGDRGGEGTRVVVESAPADSSGQPCDASLRLAAGRGGERLAAWWSARPSRAAWLLASRSTDGGRTWSRALPVDTLDRSTSGCSRPAPSVALDTLNGFAHVAYPLVAPEGEGIFYAHQMDPRAAFEPPQVVVYGERAAATSVASDGDVVVVAYEDPNTGGRPFVSLALSRTAGHTFAARVAVSGRSVAAVRPRAAVRGTRVAVGWIERPSPRTLSTLDDPSTATGPEPGFVVVRVGTVR